MDAELAKPFTQRLSRRHWVLLDGVLGALLLAGTIGAVASGREGVAPVGASWDGLRYFAAVLACVALPFRRRWPTGVLAATTVGVAALAALGVRGPAQITVALAIFSASVHSTRRLPVATVGAVVAAVLFVALIVSGGPEWGAVIGGPAVVLVGWFAGENTRVRRAYTEGLAARAAERERDRENRIRQAAIDERVRIARELHDIVAHAMSLIAVRAGAARVVIERQPDQAREALSIIETTSRRALREMRRLVGVLRRPDDTTGADLEPAPGLAHLDELLRETAQAGVHVDLQVIGTARPLPSGVEVSAFRIIQEALTNVVRHAGPTSAHLEVRYGPQDVEIELIDEGATTPDRTPSPATLEGAGHGLLGMRERVALYRGELIAEPTDHGYRVLARLPVEDDQP